MYIVSWQQYKYKYCSNLQINSRPATKQSESRGSWAIVEVTNKKNTHHILKCHKQVSEKNTTFRKKNYTVAKKLVKLGELFTNLSNRKRFALDIFSKQVLSQRLSAKFLHPNFK